ncbi:SHOCT domain-containing protein [Streptomyces sp. LARHCF249]
MFIRPVGVTVRAANRPAGRPLLRGLLARAAGPVAEGTAARTPRGLLGRAVRAAEDPGTAEDPGRVEWEPEQEQEPEGEGEGEPAPWPPDPDAPEEPPPAPPAPRTGLVSELTQLASLAREGLLTPEEFTTAKARLLRD